jgi:putative RNA 2'-phosphotransferase
MPKEAHASASRFLALILRHKPEAVGIELDEHGWANVEDLVEGIAKTRDFSVEVLEEIVSTDSKGRYSFNEDHTMIRANQGHSIAVDVELEQSVPPAALYHGTGEKYAASIDETGLMPKGRLYVHLSVDEKTATCVGARHGVPVVYVVDSGAMHADGFDFYLSKNGVWLTKAVPAKCLSKCGSGL